MLKILDRYIIKELYASFFMGVLIFTTLIVAGDILFKLANMLIRGGVSFFVVLKLFLYKLPSVVALTLPMSVLLSVLLGFGRLSSRGEVIAFMSCGVTLYRMLRPALLFAIIVVIATFGLNEGIVPITNKAANKILYTQVKKRGKLVFKENVFMREVENGKLKRVIYISKVDKNNNMQDILFQEFENDKLKQIVFAKKGKWADGKWILEEGSIYKLSESGAPKTVVTFKKQVFFSSVSPQDINRSTIKPQDLTLIQLLNYIKILKSQGMNALSLETELYLRLAIPWASIVLVMVGFPFSIVPHRGSTTAVGFGMSVAIVFSYYVVISVCKSMGENGVINPFIAAWIPNILFFFIGVVFIVKRAKKYV